MRLNSVGDQAKVIVVGAASGMGAEIVRRLVGLNARVVGLDLASASWPSDFPAESIGDIDITQEDSVDLAVDRAITKLDGLDSVVNCAGVLGPVKPLSETSSEEIGALLAVNLQGAFNITRRTLRHLVPQETGRIVHIASIAGKEGNPGMAGYSASKAGVIGMVKAVAKEIAATGVTINAVAPASIDTPLVQQQLTDERRAVQQSLIPMGRFGTVAEAAGLVEYILSSDASFTTGFTYDLSGGRTTY